MVANRVNYELTGRNIGDPDDSLDLVGFKTGDESKAEDSNIITFCTMGILLKYMESDPLIEDIGVVIVDEIQERSKEGSVCGFNERHSRE
ncbi:ATP-dependent RNA helicase DHX29 [Smittium mucronatum]|uniref:ATP-dependent RNA helicase DHX29 n=1 Tax=Smittium mucronatum TaxID=133383 RepID=A0A1R0GYL1_9FUNG|nr:ATP-dependent RNA helicase DHX29 [Smittium mucronatum]